MSERGKVSMKKELKKIGERMYKVNRDAEVTRDVRENLQQGGHRQILVRQKFKPDRCAEAGLPKKTYKYVSIIKETFF